MPVVEKSVLVEHTPAEMFRLVDDVEQYPEFIPWCGGADVHEQNEQETSATLFISYYGIHSHFSTVNRKEFPTGMTMKLRDGNFSHLDGAWHFTPLGDSACKVEFRLHYEFSNRVLEAAIGGVLHQIANSFVDSFVKRAEELYG